jgi:hypothetical protein
MKRLVFLVISIIFLTALPSLAQDAALSDEDVANIALVADAIDAVKTADSYRVRVQQNTSQHISVTIGKENYSIANDLDQVTYFQVQQTGDGLNAVGTIEQTGASEYAGSRTEYDLSFKIALVDDDLYLYVIGGGMTGMVMPDGWINLSQDATAAANPYFSSYNAESISQLYNLSMPFDQNSIIAIETLDDAEIDGQAMQVFRLEYDPLAILGSEALAVLGQSFGSQFSGEETAQILEDMFTGAAISYTVYIGDDGFLYRLEGSIAVDTTLEVQGFVLPLVMTVESTSTFSDFNQPVTIKAPVVEP